METACNYLDDKVMYVSTDERKWINRLLKMAEEHPDEVTIMNRPEENDGCLCLKCPAEYLKIAPPRHVNLTEEQRVAAAERLKNARKTSTQEGK